MTIVETSAGRLDGLQRDGHLAFLGIPYAASAGGANRFRAPQPVDPWPGVRDAHEFGLAARQSSHPIPGFAASGPQDEDCLNLNVYTPATDDGRRPVLFWIHGGGFTHGSSGEFLYNGGPLAQRGDVVVVTINYRLGALGYLYLGQHLPEEGLAANMGQLDQVAALRWVQENIANFGGDPDNVTIFGESAGAAAVGTLLSMPAAKGLFHKAILQSGSGRATAPDVAAGIVDQMLAELGLEPSSVRELLTVPADKIVEAQGAVVARNRAQGLMLGPVREPHTLPEVPYQAVAAGSAANIPVLIGTNRDEVKLFAASVRRDPIDDEELVKSVQAALGGKPENDALALVEVYRASRRARRLPDSNLDILDAISSDARFRINALRLALAQREHQEQTFVYLFTYESPARRGALGSCHALEMPFVFGTTDAPTQDRFAGTGPDVERLSVNMMDAWISFARTGDPSHDGIGQWSPYDADSRPTMIFDRESGIESDPFREEREAIEALR